MPPEAPEPQIDLSLKRASELVGLMYAENIGFQNAASELRTPDIRKKDTPEALVPVMRKAIEVVLEELNKPEGEKVSMRPEFTLKNIRTLQKLKDTRLKNKINGIQQRQVRPQSPRLGPDRQQQMLEARVQFRKGDSEKVQIALGSVATAQAGETEAQGKTSRAITALDTAQREQAQPE